MNALMQEFEQDRRRRARVGALVAVAVATGAAAWLAAPYGVVLIVKGQPLGWLLVVAGAVLLAGCIAAIVAAARAHVAATGLPGTANARFHEPVPSPDPRGGFAMNGSQLGSH